MMNVGNRGCTEDTVTKGSILAMVVADWGVHIAGVDALNFDVPMIDHEIIVMG